MSVNYDEVYPGFTECLMDLFNVVINSMKEEKLLKDLIGNESGMRVPDEYFDSLQKKIMEDLPPVVRMQPVAKLTMWQKVRPYIYMAAMFLGIWCMMKLFHTVSTSTQNMDVKPPVEAVAVLGDSESFEYLVPEAYDNDYDLIMDMGQRYDNIHDFSRDFNNALHNS